MNKFTKYIGAGALATGMLFSVSVNEPVHAVENTAAQTPYYYYNGYTKYDAKFTLDPYYVQALKVNNVKINGYKINLNAKEDYSKSKQVYDTNITLDKKNRVVQLNFPVKMNVVKKSTFMKAHAANTLLKKGVLGNKDGTYLVYKTDNNKKYMAFFDPNGYLNQMTIGGF